jgi:hypothetical protein
MALGGTLTRFLWRFVLVTGSMDTYYISSVFCETTNPFYKYLSVPSCANAPGTALVDQWNSAGIKQQFQLVPTGNTNDRGPEFYFRAVVALTLATTGCQTRVVISMRTT